jgi:hypothetical protein
MDAREGHEEAERGEAVPEVAHSRRSLASPQHLHPPRTLA